MVRVYSNKKERQILSHLGYQMSSLLRDACKIIEADDSTDNIIYMLTGTIKQLNNLLITHLKKPNRMDMN